MFMLILMIVCVILAVFSAYSFSLAVMVGGLLYDQTGYAFLALIFAAGVWWFHRKEYYP